MTFKQKLVSLIDPESATFQVLYHLRHPIKTARKWRMILKKSSIFDDEDDLHGCSLMPTALLKGTVDFIKPLSVLDVGCGSGKSLDWFLGEGIEVMGIEGSSMGIKHAKNPQFIRQEDLNKPVNLQRRFDLVWCFEVAEHIHPDFTEHFTKTLVTHSDLIVMSAAHPGQGGVGHFNEQPRAYWIELFNRLGYDHDDHGRAKVVEDWDWFPENIFLFRKKNATTSA